MNRILIVAAIILMAGCSTTTEVLSSSERTVVVKASIDNVADAQALAIVECKKYGRHARLSGKSSHHEYIYDCILLQP